jgi:hypothetical protein
MDRLVLDIIIAAIIGLALGWIVHQRAVQREKIYGGGAAAALHLLSAAAFCAALPGVLLSLLTGQGFLVAILFGFGCFILSFALMVGFAAIENAPRSAALAQTQDEGWTAEKAKTSGL